MDIDAFIAQAWTDHATDPRAVAARLTPEIAGTATEAQLIALMNLAHHVDGEHLGEWQRGIERVDALAAAPTFDADGPSGAARRRFTASLELSARPGVDGAELSVSDRIRVAAMAAGNLAERDTPRASELLRDAVDLAQSSTLEASDPVNRALAIAGNNLACTLEERADRTLAERDLMILAARTARHYWAIAGTWLETERAEYRLAMTWLQAGDWAEARTHAQNCAEIVAANEGPALERLFAWEALGLVERASGNAIGHAQALAKAREAFTQLDDADKSWCAESIEKMA